MSDDERAAARQRFLDLAASLPEIEPCEFCGRCMMAGICCAERAAQSAKSIEADRRRAQSERDKARNEARRVGVEKTRRILEEADRAAKKLRPPK